MGDLAQGEPIKHEVFTKPYEIQPELEDEKTPSNYRRFPGGEDLPDKLKVWRVQQTGKRGGGVVARSWGFGDSPDAEVLTPGINTGKESGAVGVGRHGNFLQWGFSAPPSKMTDVGRKFFLNCVCYIKRFDGKRPLIKTQNSDRFDAIRMAMLLKRISDKKYFTSSFTPEQLKAYGDNPEKLAQVYKDDYELIYRAQVFLVDEELKQLGIDSNRKVENLGKLVALLNDGEKQETARKLLQRYTEEKFATVAEWKAWFDENRERIFFSDVGGYKFYVAPKGYLELGPAVSLGGAPK